MLRQLSKSELRDKMLGAVLGHACGDALGSTTEFMTQEQIAETYGRVSGMIGEGWLNLNPGDVTDDTQMSLCVMRALMKENRKVSKFKRLCADEFSKWVYTMPIDVGGACLRGIRVYQLFGMYVDENDSDLGNGALMRALPCALLGLDKFNVAQAHVTHNNRTQTRVIEGYSEQVRSLVRGEFNLRDDLRLQSPSGHVELTYANAVYWVSSTSCFEDAVLGAVNHGGDADTIAAVTGSLAGALHGYRSIPWHWVDCLDVELVDKLEDFVNFAIDYCINSKTVIY